MKTRPYAESCDQNWRPILEAIEPRLAQAKSLLEIGSGTGQHAVRFGAAMPGVTWQTSDRAGTHAGIRMWLEEAGLPNVRAPVALDVLQDPWPGEVYDAVFSANTAHIMPVEAVSAMFEGVSRVLRPGGSFFLYGPFMYNGRHTSESNQHFDHWLREQSPERGVRDLEWLLGMARPLGLDLAEDLEMPVNNRILVWSKTIA